MSDSPFVPHPSGQGWTVSTADGTVYELRLAAAEIATAHRELISAASPAQEPPKPAQSKRRCRVAPDRTRRTTTGRVLALVGG